MTFWIITAIVGAFAAGAMSAMLLRARAGSETEPGVAAEGAHAQRPAGSEELATPATTGSLPSSLLVDQRSVAGAALGAIVALAMVGLYASIEPPEPTTQRSATEGADAVERLAMLTQQRPEMQSAAPQAGLASVDEMIERLAARLRQNPSDPEGWRMLGWSYFSTQRFHESAAAYLKAIELRPDAAEFRSLHGEALVSAADGTITAEAMQAFDEALARDPAEPKARYFKGLAKAQAGDKAAALEDWIRILNESGSSEPWQVELKQRTADLARELGVDISARLRNRQAAASGDILKALAGPQPGPARPAAVLPDALATGTAPPADQTAMIRGMVDGLAARLEQSPRDAEGWIKLMRSRVVLGETDRAKQALERALREFENAPTERGLITSAAQQLRISR
jgi:cytochrome c-type biogenesis protein CcmH